MFFTSPNQNSAGDSRIFTIFGQFRCTEIFLKISVSNFCGNHKTGHKYNKYIRRIINITYIKLYHKKLGFVINTITISILRVMENKLLKNTVFFRPWIFFFARKFRNFGQTSKNFISVFERSLTLFLFGENFIFRAIQNI